MGSSESIPIQQHNEAIKSVASIHHYFVEKYNLLPSYPGFEYKWLDFTTLKRKFNVEETPPKYIDLRSHFPQIQNIGAFPFNPIQSIIYLLHYQLLRNNLPVFPPSAMYIFRNIGFFRSMRSLFTFESVFDSIKENGICSENEFPTHKDTLHVELPSKVIERACAFKFIDVYRIEQSLETIKVLLSNKYPVVVGFSVYYDFSTVESYMWMPDPAIDKKLGGLSGVLVGYIDDRRMFIMATTFGTGFGSNGYVLVPYDYILDKQLTFEIYTLDFIRERVEGYINQRKEIVQLESATRENRIETTQRYREDQFGGLFK